MAEGQGNLVPVQTEVVLQTLVEHMFTTVEERRADELPAAIAEVLEADDVDVAAGRDPALDRGLRHAGYLARVVEAEMFEPARQPADWIPEMLRERFAITQSWPSAVASVSAGLARSEPLGKPRPSDEAAMTWRIPGPGGHVRHYVVKRTIEAHVSASGAAPSGDLGPLKRPWLYGFFVRACEEALPPEAVLGEES